MRFRHSDGTAVRVAWHMNVPAGDVVGVLDRFAEPVRMRLGVDRLGLGLWLGDDAVADLLADSAAVRRLRRELAARELDVVTLDAVDFDAAGGYQPDWADPRRAGYTLACARLLAELLPDNVVHGSVGTLPLGWRAPWTPAHTASAQRALAGVADGLAELHWATGRRVRVGLVPEPGCVVERTGRAITILSIVDNEWIGVALDTCHVAVAFEPPADSVRRLSSACLPVVKAQVSAAAELPGGPHADRPWRAHVHLPLSAAPAQPLSATVDVTVDTMEALFDRTAGAQTDHVEVGVGVEPHTIETAVAELAWTRDRLIQVGLKEI